MDFKKFIIGTLAGGVVAFLLGWLIYGVILMSYMQKHCGSAGNVSRAEPLMLYLVLGNLFFGAFLAFVFIKANVKSLVDGFITAAILGFLVTVSYDCMIYGLTTITSKHAILADVIASTIMTGVVGAVVAVVTGGKKEG